MTLGMLLFATDVAYAGENQSEKNQIVVSGNRDTQAEIVADVAKSITLTPPKDQPLPRHYQPICIKTFGLEKDYAEILEQRIRDNIRVLNISLGSAKCQPNSWVGFVANSYDSVARLRKEEPAMFSTLNDYEVDRILAGSKAAQAWHALEAKGADGKPFNYVTIEIGGVPKTVRVNNQFQTGRLVPMTRVDMMGSIVLFDGRLIAGKTIAQLADYATFRLLAPVKELSSDTGNAETILSLFADDATPPGGLTEFDWTYLHAYYMLSAGTKPERIHDAVKSSFLSSAGQKRVENPGPSDND